MKKHTTREIFEHNSYDEADDGYKWIVYNIERDSILLKEEFVSLVDLKKWIKSDKVKKIIGKQIYDCGDSDIAVEELLKELK